MKKDDKLVRYSKQCKYRSIIERDESPYSHEDKYKTEHKYIRASTFQRQIGKYRAQLQILVSPYKKFQKSILQALGSFKNQIEKLIQKIKNQIQQTIQNQYIPNFSKNKKKLYRYFIDNNLSDLSCIDVSEMYAVIEEASDIKSQSQQSKIHQKCLKIGDRLNKDLHLIYSDSKQDIQKICKIDLLSQSSLTMKKKEDSFSPSSYSLLQHFGNYQSKINDSKNSQHHKITQQQSRLNQSELYDTGSNYYDQLQKYSKQNQSSSFNLQMMLSNYTLNEIGKSQNLIIDLPNIQDQDQEEDQDLLNQTIIQTEIEVSKLPKCLDVQKFTKISQIKQQLNRQDLKFNLKVRICKVLYHLVKKNANVYIPKIKFIAGDQTGLSVFFTNYVSGIKVGAQLELHNCNLGYLKNSPEIMNDSNFRVMNSSQANITVNYKGIKISSYIKQIGKDLYYNMPDTKCSLIRHVAAKAKENLSIDVGKMIVRVKFIIKEWSKGIFCQVGDSSGSMLAYIKKQDIKEYKQKDVLRLMKTKAQIGKQRGGLFQQKIVFIDAYLQQSKIYAFNLQFPQINEETMNLSQ